MYNLHLIALSFYPLLLLRWPHLLNDTLIILEISSIKCLEGWEPNGEPGSELGVSDLVREYWVAGVLH